MQLLRYKLSRHNLSVKILIFIVFCTLSGNCYGQSSWLDFSRAIPRVLAPGGAPNFNTGSTSFPSTGSYDSSSNAFGGFSGAGPVLAPGRKDWKLGVYVQNTDVGAVVTQVAPNSAGQQAGLEPNDIIVAVGGSRIGSFDNRIIELADEIRRNTDSFGRVSLIVFNSRQRTIASLPVSMNSTSSTLTGSVSIRDRSQLPYGSMLTVQLQNTSKPYYEISGGKSITRADGFGPYAFELYFDPRYVDPRDQYQLIASITIGNQVAYGLPQPIAVDVNNLGQSMNLLLESASGGQAFGNSGQPSNFPPGSVVNVGYPGSVNSNGLTELFLQLLGRSPSAREVIAWQAYLQQGNSINDLKVKLMASSQFRERFGSDAAFMQQVVSLLTNRAPNQQELAYWMTRLQSTGSPEMIISEILAKNR